MDTQDFDAPFTTPPAALAPKPARAKPKAFWSGLIRGQLNIERQSLLGLWPGMACFAWFLSLVLFGGMSLFIYILHGTPEKALEVFGLITALHLGALVVLFLATVVENPDPKEKAEGPFALSLQASFVEGLGVAGLLVFIISKDKIENLTLPIFNKYLHIAAPDYTAREGAYLFIYGALLVAILCLAFFGFSLLRRRERLTSPVLRGQFQNEGQPPIGSDSPRQGLAYLTRLKADLVQMAARASQQVDKNDTRLKLMASEWAQTETELLAVQAEIQALIQDHEDFGATRTALKAQIDRLAIKAGDPARLRSRKWLEKIKRLMVSGLGVVDSGDALFLDALERLQLTEQALEDSLNQRTHDARALEAEQKEARAEAQKLTSETARLEAEREELSRFAEHIDETNEAWRQPYEWTAFIGKEELTVSHVIPANTYNTARLNAKGADTIDKIRSGMVWLFGFTAILAVIGDFLLEMPNVPEGGTSVLTGVGVTSLVACFVLYWVFKLVYSLGLMGSWRSITASYRNERDEDSAPEWSGTLKVMGANALGILAFAALIIPFGAWINALAAGDKTRFIKASWFGENLKDIDLRVMTDMLAGPYNIILTLLMISGILMFVAPLFIHIWEAQFRRTKDHSSAMAIFKAIVMAMAGLGALALISLGSQWVSDAVKAHLVKDTDPQSPVSHAVPQTLFQCPIDLVTTKNGVRVNAWRLGADNEVVLNLTSSLMTRPPTCQIDIAPLGDTNFIVLIGTASEQGGFERERKRAAERIDNAASFLSPGLREAITSAKISIYSVNLGKYCALPKPGRVTEAACLRANRAPGDKGDITARQRPLIMISGHVDATEDITAEAQVEQKVNDALSGLGIDQNNYPDPKLDKRPVKRKLTCPAGKPCTLTLAPRAKSVAAPIQLPVEKDEALNPATPAPDGSVPPEAGPTPPETAATLPPAQGH